MLSLVTIKIPPITCTVELIFCFIFKRFLHRQFYYYYYSDPIYLFYILDSPGNTVFAHYYTLGTVGKQASTGFSHLQLQTVVVVLSPRTVTWRGQDDRESYFEVLHANPCYNQQNRMCFSWECLQQGERVSGKHVQL